MEPDQTVLAAVGRILDSQVLRAEVVDRDLDIGRQRCVPYVLVDEDGRAVFVIAAEHADSALVLLALDVLAFARQHPGALARHCDSERLRPDLGPCVWLVARSFEPEMRGRLAMLEPSSVRAFELVRLESRRGAREYLSELQLRGSDRGDAGEGPELGFLEALDTALVPLGELIVRRVSRLDETLEAARTHDSITWLCGEEIVCSVSARRGAVRGHVPGASFEDAIASRADAERFLDLVVQRYLELEGGAAQVSAPGFSLREPLLTPEELAAFDPSR